MTTQPFRLTFGEHQFSSAAAAIRFFRDMLNKHAAGDVIDDPKDQAALQDLVAQREAAVPAKDRKIGVGIDHFKVWWGVGAGFSTHCFWLVRKDKTEVDFSYIKAVRAVARHTRDSA